MGNHVENRIKTTKYLFGLFYKIEIFDGEGKKLVRKFCWKYKIVGNLFVINKTLIHPAGEVYCIEEDCGNGLFLTTNYQLVNRYKGEAHIGYIESYNIISTNGDILLSLEKSFLSYDDFVLREHCTLHFRNDFFEVREMTDEGVKLGAYNLSGKLIVAARYVKIDKVGTLFRCEKLGGGNDYVPDPDKAEY